MSARTFILTGWLALGFMAGAQTTEDIPRTTKGYRIPTPNHEFVFPRDHGSHPEFRIEWWYFTGHLNAADGRRFGFQATFFRYALRPDATGENGEYFGSDQLYMAHMGLSDLNTKKFYHEERLNRNGWDAHAREDDLDIRNGNWTLARVTNETMRLMASIGAEVGLDLTFEPRKPKVIFGEDRLSRKGADPSACSWYITFPRLAVTGAIKWPGEQMPVSGEAWMDHEISSSQLDREQVGWDWASLRLHDGREIMVYILRDREGRPDSYSTLAWIDEKGTVIHLGPDRFEWKAQDVWTSPETGARYPLDILLTGPDPATGKPFSYRIRPLMKNQEMVGQVGGIAYWEGACEVLEGDRVIGEAYVELTGYAKDLGKELR